MVRDGFLYIPASDRICRIVCYSIRCSVSFALSCYLVFSHYAHLVSLLQDALCDIVALHTQRHITSPFFLGFAESVVKFSLHKMGHTHHHGILQEVEDLIPKIEQGIENMAMDAR